MIWRDDDILYADSRLEDLLAVDDDLRAYGRRHTVAVLASLLTPAIATVLVERGMDVQLHAWSHEDLTVSASARADLPAAVRRIEELVGTRPTVLYPPWNRTSPALNKAASDLGLVVSAEKISLEYYLRRNGSVPGSSVINFHYWHEPNRILLKQALALAAQREAA
jgi:peptidoglycan/xylan/chitin deacetylase (PgdA/CDA1 family)